MTSAYAAPMHIQCFGATQVVNGGDTLFIFKGDIHVKSTIGSVNWHSIETGSVETGIEEQLDLDEGGYYLESGGVTYAPFYVFKCPVADVKMTMTPSCDNTLLRLTGNVSPFTYTRQDGTTGTRARTYSLEYNALAWNGDAWADSLVEKTGNLSRTISLPALYGPTELTLCYDKDIRSKLDLDSVCVKDSLLPDSVIAINFHLESLATIRGEKGEKSNELNRPTDQKCITATTSDDYSGALEVAFYSNPTPSPHPIFYKWSIYKATELLTTRNDQDIRYSFSEPGSYRVICSVNSYTCRLDSQEMKVNISESYLRVPNVFTPNGDGKNDEFRVSYRSLRDFHIWVYNRWGKLVYESTDPAKGWDGTINGRPAAESAYFYVVRAMGTDAAKNASYIGLKPVYNKKKKMNDQSILGIYQLSGDINLLRGKKK
jgi:gliding motility-associated-like protein